VLNDKSDIHIKTIEASVLSFNQPEPEFNTVIIRLAGEIGIKAAWTRKLYERRLISNIKAVLKHHAIPYGALNRRFGRLYLRTSHAQDASQKLAKVFGISSVSPALETTSKLDDIIEASLHIARSKLTRGCSFAVRCRRVGEHPYTSQEVCREVGREILDAYPQLGLRVDLKNPDVTLGIEVREDKAFVFADTIKGEGGLPVGTQPKLVCLLKGDVNSTVACWLTMKRGCRAVLLHFDNSTFVKRSSLDSVLRHAEALSEWMIGFPRKLKVVSHGQNLAEIVEKCPRDLTSLLCKRLMFRIAERIAESEGAEGIVTGENLDNKNGLTPHDLRVEDEAVKNHPVHRPVHGFGKSEIERLARKLGIEETPIQTRKQKAVKRKQKHAILEDIKQAEGNLKIDKMIETSLRTLRTLNLTCSSPLERFEKK